MRRKQLLQSLSINADWKTIMANDNLFTKFIDRYFGVDDMDEAWKWLKYD